MLKILYAGSPEPSALLLELLLNDTSLTESDCSIVGVLSNPPSAQGRHKELIPTPVDTIAEKKGIPVFTPEHLDSELRSKIAPLGADLLVCFAYGHIFGPKFLAMFKYGGINLHPSLLPRYRGCTPVPAAILHRDIETGISVQKLALEMDAGDLLAQVKIPLAGTETAGSLLEESARTGAQMLSAILCGISVSGKFPDTAPQTGVPSYTELIQKEDGHIDWKKSAEEIDAQIRAYTPDPGCWTMSGTQMLRILEAHLVSGSSADAVPGTVAAYDKKEGILFCTGSGLLAVTRLQWQTKKAMEYRDFMNGSRNFVSTVLQ